MSNPYGQCMHCSISCPFSSLIYRRYFKPFFGRISNKKSEIKTRFSLRLNWQNFTSAQEVKAAFSEKIFFRFGSKRNEKFCSRSPDFLSMTTHRFVIIRPKMNTRDLMKFKIANLESEFNCVKFPALI